MDEIYLEISTKYTSMATYCKIYCCDEIIFDGDVNKNIKLSFQKPTNKPFKLEIFKSGKTLELVKKKQEQRLIVEKLFLNGIELKIKEFGFFQVKNNDFVKDHVLQTNVLDLNGIWTFQLPERELIGHIDEKKVGKLFGKLSNTDIACFGCSETMGLHNEKNKDWPSVLAGITNKNVNNYGIGGSNVNEITAFIKYYVENFKCDIIVMLLPHTMRKQIYDRESDEYINVKSADKSNKELILHGEEHSVASLSGKLKNFCETVTSNKIKFLFSSTHRSEYILFSKTQCTSHMLPLVDKELFPKASDGMHGGIEYNRAFADSILNYI